MKECFGYIRVSTVKQGEGVSLQEQKDAILAFAERNNLEVVEWFEEKETAAKSGRPVFNAMLRKLRRSKDKGVIMHKIDRSARNLKDWSVVAELPDEGIDVHVAMESIDFSTRGGRLTADVLAVISADYIRNLRDEIQKGIRGRLKQGIYPLPAPVGYLDNGSGKPKTPCPEKAPLIKETFTLYATGKYSLRTLREEMVRRGLKNKTGSPISRGAIERILGNPFYTGIIAIKKTGESFQGIHEPIISSTVFQYVQEIKKGRYGPKTTKHSRLYQGLFRCGLCKGAMTPEQHKGHIYYRCQTQECPTKTVREEILDENITKALKEYEPTDTASRVLYEKWDEEIAKIADDGRRKTLSLRIRTLEQQLDTAATHLMDGVLDKDTYLAKKQELILEIVELKDQVRTQTELHSFKKKNTQYQSVLTHLSELYERLEKDEKRVFMKNTFSNRTVVGKRPYFKPHSWIERKDCARCPIQCSNSGYRTNFEVPNEIWLLYKKYFGKQGGE